MKQHFRVRFFCIGIGLTTLTLLSGCIFGSPKPVTYFDLPSNDFSLNIPDAPVQVEEFENRSPAGTRFLLRRSDGSILELSECKWVQEPGELVARYLSRMFAGEGLAGNPMVVTGSLSEFTFSESAMQFELCGVYQIEAAKRLPVRRDFRIREHFQSMSIEDRTHAVASAVAQLAQKIANDISEFQSHSADAAPSVPAEKGQ